MKSHRNINGILSTIRKTAYLPPPPPPWCSHLYACESVISVNWRFILTIIIIFQSVWLKFYYWSVLTDEMKSKTRMSLYTYTIIYISSLGLIWFYTNYCPCLIVYCRSILHEKVELRNGPTTPKMVFDGSVWFLLEKTRKTSCLY